MKKPTQDLVDEHGGIMLMLKILEKIAGRLKNGGEIDRGHLDKIVEFLQNFVDKCHHGKEEGILFPQLIDDADKPLINELLGEHKTGRDLVAGIVASIDNLKSGNPDAYHIAVNSSEFIKLLTEHIRKENTVLFPLADKKLPADLQQEIEEKFEVLERDIIGAGKHELYHSWLVELENYYLK